MGQLERWGTRGLFVSSTFEDMHAERDFLQDVVFRELEELLRKTRHWLAPVDLRWGIDTVALPPIIGQDDPDAVEHQKHLVVLTHCLYCVGICRPFMIVLLGDRYGWIPPIERVRQAAQVVRFRGEMADRSVTAFEIEYGVLDSQAQMQRTHFFFRKLDDTEMSLENRQRFSDTQRAAHEKDSVRSKEALRSAHLLEQLKQRIAATCPGRVHSYQAKWKPGEGVTAFQDELRCLIVEHVGKDLLEGTSNELLREPRDWVEAEARSLEEFIDFRLRIFLGREAIASELLDFCLSPVDDPAGSVRCIVGDPGIGKSSLFAYLHRELDRAHLGQLREDLLRPEQRTRLRQLQQHDAVLLGHAAGMSPRSTSVRDLLLRWIRELALAVGEGDPASEGTGIDELRGLFSSLLFRSAERRRVILLLDGLNLFERTDLARYLQWLPRDLPANCRVLGTANAGDESAEFERRGWPVTALEPLGEEAINTIFTDVCEQLYNRQGDRFEKVRTALVGKRDRAGHQSGGNPLWLRLALDLLNQLNEETYTRQRAEAYQGLPADVRLNALLSDVVEEMPGDVEQLYGWLLKRSEAAAGHFGQTADARLFACLIALSRNGLREKDLKALLSSLSGEPWSDLRLAVLRRTFLAHLVQRGDLAQWDFFHGQMRAAVRQHYLTEPSIEIGFLRSIALYLSGRLAGAAPLPADDPLAERELMHHWLMCGDETEIAHCCGALLPGTQKAATALGELVQDCCRSDRTDEDGISWLRRVVDRLAIEFEAGRVIDLAANVLLLLKTFAGVKRRAGFAQVFWHLLEQVKAALPVETQILHMVAFQTELAQALLASGDLANAAWHFLKTVQLVNESASFVQAPESLLFEQCRACQAIAGILATPIVLQFYDQAIRYLDSACALASRDHSTSSPLDSRWALQYVSVLIDGVSLVPEESRQRLIDMARSATTKIHFEPARNHALGVIALSQARHMEAIGEDSEPEVRASVAILKQVHAAFPSTLEPLQHLIEARHNLFLIEYPRTGYSPEIADETQAELSRLTAQLDRLSNGNKDLHPAPFLNVDVLGHVFYWVSWNKQLRKLIGEKDFERAEFLMELAWQALRNLTRRGAWAPVGKSIEEHLADVASHNLAIATLKRPGNTDSDLLARAMRRIVEAVVLSLAKKRPVNPGLHQVYETLLQAQPALADGVLEGASLENVSNANWLFKPRLRFDGTAWCDHRNAIGLFRSDGGSS